MIGPLEIRQPEHELWKTKKKKLNKEITRTDWSRRKEKRSPTPKGKKR